MALTDSCLAAILFSVGKLSDPFHTLKTNSEEAAAAEGFWVQDESPSDSPAGDLLLAILDEGFLQQPDHDLSAAGALSGDEVLKLLQNAHDRISWRKAIVGSSCLSPRRRCRKPLHQLSNAQSLGLPNELRNLFCKARRVENGPAGKHVERAQAPATRAGRGRRPLGQRSPAPLTRHVDVNHRAAFLDRRKILPQHVGDLRGAVHLVPEVVDLPIVLLERAAYGVLELVDPHKVREEGEDVFNLEQPRRLFQKSHGLTDPCRLAVAAFLACIDHMPGDCEPELAPHRRVILRALGDFLGELHVDPEGEGGRVLEHAHVAEQLHARPLPVALAGEAEGKLLVVERPPKGALGPAEVGDQLRLVALRRVEGDREVVQGGVIAAELVDGKLHVAKRLSKALSAGGRLVAADERRHEAALELVDELPGDRGLPQDAERADDLPALHQVLDDGLVVVQERCQVHELVEAAVAREQVARGRAVEDVLVLGEEIPQLIHE
eukprot:CAMPEP_0177623774 /NCGR_PEP_ID=MMETSP0419_2-20121207/29095_1 /TAXON_ID=582737 /ORGANISM="Tetraselmis sp., Strain GSL018" /LENGTH=492 /DNA_ID=CAMNT_0019124375 /DNA_START=99 /DNA_END=1575 /DNA_ORIENTATION=-